MGLVSLVSFCCDLAAAAAAAAAAIPPPAKGLVLESELPSLVLFFCWVLEAAAGLDSESFSMPRLELKPGRCLDSDSIVTLDIPDVGCQLSFMNGNDKIERMSPTDSLWCGSKWVSSLLTILEVILAWSK